MIRAVLLYLLKLAGATPIMVEGPHTLVQQREAQRAYAENAIAQTIFSMALAVRISGCNPVSDENLVTIAETSRRASRIFANGSP